MRARSLVVLLALVTATLCPTLFRFLAASLPEAAASSRKIEGGTGNALPSRSSVR